MLVVWKKYPNQFATSGSMGINPDETSDRETALVWWLTDSMAINGASKVDWNRQDKYNDMEARFSC